jgi:hypothetical protein
MKIQVHINGKEQNVYNSADFDERLDEQLDTGSIQIISNDKEPFEDFCTVKVELIDDETNEPPAYISPKTAYFFGFDTVEKRGGHYFIHNLELVEPTRLLMGIFICGRKVTQPISGAKKSIYTVCEELVSTMSLLLQNASPMFSFGIDSAYMYMPCPEFHWEEGTTLWECLCDVANVVDSVPRLSIVEETGKLTRIVFDKINKEIGVYEM